jgi:hypothetical protein
MMNVTVKGEKVPGYKLQVAGKYSFRIALKSRIVVNALEPVTCNMQPVSDYPYLPGYLNACYYLLYHIIRRRALHFLLRR